MPIDSDGNRAEMIVDPKSTIGRLNIGRLYERYLKAGANKARNILLGMLGHREIDDLELYEVKELFAVALEFVKLLGSRQASTWQRAVDNDDVEAMMDTLETIIEEKFYMFVTADGDTRKYEIVNNILNSKFKPPYGKVDYIYKGKPVTSEGNVMIAPMYIFLLSKIADTTLSTSSAKVNHFGLPIVVSKANKFSKPSRESPVRNIGETEGRLMVSYGGREFLAELKDRSASTQSHSLAYRNILNADQPTNIPRLIDRKHHPYGTDRGLEILESLWNSVGMELAYVPDNNKLYPYHEGLEVIPDGESVDIEDLGESDIDEY